MEAIKEFFVNNPEAEKCYLALGVAYADEAEANKMVAATTAKVQAWSKDGLITEDNSELKKAISVKNAQIDKLTSELSEANVTINSLGGPTKETPKIKELQSANADLIDQVKDLVAKLKTATDENSVLKSELDELKAKMPTA